MTTTTTQQRFNTYIPVRVGIYVAYWTAAFILFSFLFGIMKYPARDFGTLPIMQQIEYSKLQTKYRTNQNQMIELERLEYITTDRVTYSTIQNIENEIKTLKKENLLLNQKMSKISAKAKYKSWQYRLSDLMGWQFPFNLHKL